MIFFMFLLEILTQWATAQHFYWCGGDATTLFVMAPAIFI